MSERDSGTKRRTRSLRNGARCKTSIRNRLVFRYLRAVLLLWGVGVSAAAAAEPDRDRCAGGVAAADASRLNSAVVAAAVVGPVVRTWHQSLLRPTSQPSAGDDGAVDIRILRSLHKNKNERIQLEE